MTSPPEPWRQELAAGPQPCFVIGSGRCGSTLLYQWLARHPAVAMTNEAHLVDYLHFAHALAAHPAYEPRVYTLYESITLHGIVGHRYAARFAEVLLEHSGQMLLEFYRREFPDKRFAWFGDKLADPEAIAALHALFPGLRCFLLVRDPRDVVCSRRDYAARPEVQAGDPFFRLDDLEEFCTRWTMLYENGRAHLPNTLLLRYEDLVARPEAELARVMAHLALPPHPEQLHPASEEQLRRGHATTQSAQQSVARWRRDLPAADLTVVERICAPVMRACGYAPSSSRRS